MPTLVAKVKREPLSAVLVFVMAAAAAGLAALSLGGRPAVSAPPVPAPSAILAPHEAWRAAADPEDVLSVPGYAVAYWGDPNASYGKGVTDRKKPFRAIAIHYTVAKPVLNFVKYQHNGDDRRGGSYGYHVYIGQDGSITQGAPLSVRTNHIKRRGHSKRSRLVGKWADGSDTIGVSFVGACETAGRSITDVKCIGWQATDAQKAAGAAAIVAIMKRYDISPCHVWGHGELQRDRRRYEGRDVAKAIRKRCDK